MEHLRKPLSKMAMKLFLAAKELYPDENVVISPFTVSSIITMLYYASEGTPMCKQMENLLHYSELFEGRSDPRAILMAFREATRVLTKSKKGVEVEAPDHSPEFRMVLANRVFVQKNANIHPDFLEIIQKNLQIEFEQLNFAEDKEAEGSIDKWLKAKIRSKMDGSKMDGSKMDGHLFDEKYTGPRMVIASAAHFQSDWEVKFDAKQTVKAPFYTSSGKFKQVDMMHLTDKFPFYEEKELGMKMLELPFFHNEVTVVLTMPAKKGLSLAEMAKGMTPEFLVELHMRKRMKNVKITLPKFHFHSEYNLKKLMNQIGIKDIFHADAVLKRMTDESVFRVSEGVHKCAIQIDEEGCFVTEHANASTNHNVGHDKSVHTPPTQHKSNGKVLPVALPPGTDEFTANQPFLFAVRHNRSGIFLFSGRVLLP